jgi:hypothetical protein
VIRRDKKQVGVMVAFLDQPLSGRGRGFVSRAAKEAVCFCWPPVKAVASKACPCGSMSHSKTVRQIHSCPPVLMPTRRPVDRRGGFSDPSFFVCDRDRVAMLCHTLLFVKIESF